MVDEERQPVDVRGRDDGGRHYARMERMVGGVVPMPASELTAVDNDRGSVPTAGRPSVARYVSEYALYTDHDPHVAGESFVVRRADEAFGSVEAGAVNAGIAYERGESRGTVGHRCAGKVYALHGICIIVALFYERRHLAYR